MTPTKLLFLLKAYLLAGCAISPQSITLNPSVTVDQKDIGQGRSVNLSVVDKRETKALGSRGGIYARTALLTIAGGPEEPIRQELAGALNAYGFSVINALNADINMVVEIETLSYEKTAETYPMLINNNILLKAICNKPEAEFTSRYSANKAQNMVATPTISQNEKMINELVSKALTALLNDQRLLDFLR